MRKKNGFSFRNEMNRTRSALMTAALVLVAAGAGQADTVTNTSSNFSLGYGYTTDPAWTTTETSGANTPTTQGSFSFTPTVSGSFFSGNGPTFLSRVLAGASGSANESGDSS